MRSVYAAFLLGLCLTVPLPAEEKSFSEKGLSLKYNDAAFSAARIEMKKKLTIQEVGTDIPEEVWPAHASIRLQEKTAKDADDSRSQISVIPLADKSVKSFAKAYPDVNEGATKLKAFLKKSPKEIPWLSASDEKPKGPIIPDPVLFTAAPAFQIKLSYLENEQLHGVFYLVQYTQEFPFYPTNDTVSYSFFGLSKDGRFSVSAEFAVSHTSLPASWDKIPDSAREANGTITEVTLKKVVGKLAQEPDDSFTPKLTELRAVIESLKLPAK
jgi:hypothetical protein